MSDRKRPPIAVFILLLFIGLLSFFSVTGRPSFETYRTVDVIQLLGSGASIGAALAGIPMSIVLRRSRDGCPRS
jgi:hypothetical protein